MSTDQHNPIQHPEVQMASTPGYLISFVVALVLMGIGLDIVHHHSLTGVDGKVVLAIIGLAAVFIQSYLLFHLTWSETQRWYTVSYLLAIPLFVLLLGLSLWLFHTLAVRTSIPGLH